MKEENLGPAERMIQLVTTHIDHMVHNRPGSVSIGNPGSWKPGIVQHENEKSILYEVSIKKKRRIGELKNNILVNNPNIRYQPSGLYPEVVELIYKQISDIWKLDNEFAAKWASWVHINESKRDLKVALAAFMLVQNRFGVVVKDGEAILQDEDYREVGEAMCLLKGLNPKLLLRIGDLLKLPEIQKINQDLEFGKTTRNPILGRYPKTIKKWLCHIEDNPTILKNLVKAGFRTSVMELSRRVGFKPRGKEFFQILRWKQVQAKEGHRSIAIGESVEAPETWENLTEEDICKKITKEKINGKVAMGKLGSIGLTPSIMAAIIESEGFSNQDLIIFTPTLEEFGLLSIPEVRERWQKAVNHAENQRAENIKKNVRSKVAKEGLTKAVDVSLSKEVEKSTRGMQIYLIVDKSGSMSNSINVAKDYVCRFAGAFPLDHLHVCMFNTIGSIIDIKSPTRAGVEQAFRGHTAGGGTFYAAGLKTLYDKFPTSPDEDLFIIFVGDQQDNNVGVLEGELKKCRPVGIGMLQIGNKPPFRCMGCPIVEHAASKLEIPLIEISEEIFKDPYAVPRTIRTMLESVPRVKTKIKGIVESILETPLLKKPVWA